MLGGLKQRVGTEKLKGLRKLPGLKKVKVWQVAVVIVAAAALFAAAIMNGGEEIETVKLQPGTIIRQVEETGYVQPVSDYFFEATQAARVDRILVETGQYVDEGETLVVLENLDLGVQIAEASVRLAQMQAAAASAEAAFGKMQLLFDDSRQRLERTEQLFNAGAVSKAEHEQAALELETYRRNLAELKIGLESSRNQAVETGWMLERLKTKETQLTVVSPVQGRVLALPLKREQAVLPGTPLVKIGVPGELEIKADIISDDLAAVREGQIALISAPVLGDKILAGQVKKIFPQAEEKLSALGVVQRRVPVIIALEDEAGVLQPGYEVKVAIETQKIENVPILPREAVRTNASGGKEVLRIVAGKVKVQVVETGASDRANVEIKSGLSINDLVVKDASRDLPENTKVKTTK